MRTLIGLLAALAFLGVCAATSAQETEVRRGVVEQITPTQIQSNHH